ncbi:MAG: hypothetical protein FJ122_03655 [Deltaproteobacteria bacterium]|nr:hypothetical protein [Deltaproteobacteria bacterium]
MKKADYLTGLALILLSIYVLAESWRMPRLEHLQAHPLSVPGIVPAFLAAILLIFGLILVGRSVKDGGHRLALSREGIRRSLADPGNQRLLLTAVLTFVYAGVLVGRVSYGLATGLFIFLFVAVFEWRRGMSPREMGRVGLAAAILAIVFTAAVSYTFERLFLVTLP